MRLASRGSPLALAQARLAIDALRAVDPAPGIESIEDIEIVRVRTEGDRDRESPLSEIGGRGVFVRAVERALLEGRADLAVHSLKDVPVEVPEDLALAAMLPRGDPRDALVASGGRRLADLEAGARVGTGSARRAALLRALRPDVEVVALRGNVDTRLRRVAEGALDGVLVAAAGLDRLGRLDEATQLFEAHEFVPAPGQGTVVLQCRAGDEPVRALLAAVDDPETRAAAEAERGFLAGLGSGCTLPIGAYAQVADGLLAVRGMIGAADGGPPSFGDATGPLDEAAALGRGLAVRLLEMIDAADGRAGTPPEHPA